MKRARPWIEEVTFVECPYCDECIDLGTEAAVDQDEEYACDHCKKTFVMDETP